MKLPMKSLLSVIFCGFLAAGCGNKGGFSRKPYQDFYAPARVPGHWEWTSRGTPVWIPNWLNTDPLIKDEALREIDLTLPDADSRIPVGTAGAPIGYSVIIQDPGSFSTPASPTGLAVGYTDMRSMIYVAWRRYPTDFPFMPALGHEYRHVYTGDVLAGH